MTDARIDLIHDLVSSAAASVPDRAAIVTSDGVTASFAEFDRQIRARAAWVAERTRRGDRVAVIADNSADYAQLYYAVPRSGRVLATINQRLSPGDQITQLAISEPILVVGDSRYLSTLSGLAQRVRTVPFDGPEWVPSDADPDIVATSEPDDPAWLLFTSGSTAAPKGVVHTHRSITTAVRGGVAGRSVQPGGVYLLPFPMCHIAGHNMLVQHAALATVVPVAAFGPEQFVELVNAHGVTSCSLAPTMLHSLLAHLEQTGEQMPSLRDIAYGSAAISADLLRRAIERLDVGFHQGYGMTETGGNVTFLGPAEHRAGMSGDVAILASAGRPHDEVEVQLGDDGEILVRGEQVAAGYWPGMTPPAPDGWLHTGDVGRFDADGRLVVTDRLKDVIVTGGENVSSREVEDVLSIHPDVEMSAVVGVPDAYWGEAVCAVVVASADRHPIADDLISHVRDHITAFKRPRHIVFVDTLPLTTNGKVDKAAVRRVARAATGT